MYDIACEAQPAQTLLTMSAILSQEGVGGFLAAAYPALFARIEQAGAQPVGPPIARYRVDEQAFHVTAGVPFSGHVPAADGMTVQALPAATVATTTHVGSYDGLPAAFHAVIEWTSAHGYRIDGDPWESYLDGPEVAEPRTKVSFPVVRS